MMSPYDMNREDSRIMALMRQPRTAMEVLMMESERPADYTKILQDFYAAGKDVAWGNFIDNVLGPTFQRLEDYNRLAVAPTTECDLANFETMAIFG